MTYHKAITLSLSLLYTACTFSMDSDDEKLLLGDGTTVSSEEEPLVTTLSNISQKLAKNIQKGSRCFAPLILVHGEYKDIKAEYRALVHTKQHEQTVEFPTDIQGYAPSILDLQNQNLHTALFNVPTYISASGITSIDVSHNNLTDLPLPYIIKKFPNLKKLIASHNMIAHVLPNSNRLIRWQSLSLQDWIPLEHLDVSHNQLNSLDLGTILELYPNLTNIDISCNPLTEIRWKQNNITFKKDKLPTINIQSTQLSSKDKELILQQYTQNAQHELTRNMYIKSYGIGCTSGLIPLCSAPWILNMGLPIAGEITGLIVPAAVVFGIIKVTAHSVLEHKNKAELAGIQQQVKSSLLYDEISDEDALSDASDETIDIPTGWTD